MDKLWKKSTSQHPNLKKLCAVVSTSEAPQFYITPKQALEKYNEYKRTGTIAHCGSSEVTRSMYKAIFERYEVASANSRGLDFKYSIMQDVLESPAPSFYISPNTAFAFYYRAMAYKRTLAHIWFTLL